MSKPRFDPSDIHCSSAVYKESPQCYENIDRYDHYNTQEKRSDGLSEKFTSFIKDLSFDDVLIIAIFILLFNENKQDDYLILLILAVLFFS